jgi:hypothetical protein
MLPKPESDTLLCSDSPPEEIIEIQTISGNISDNTKTNTVKPQLQFTDITAVQNFETVLRLIESGKIRDSAASKCPSAATVKLNFRASE